MVIKSFVDILFAIKFEINEELFFSKIPKSFIVILFHNLNINLLKNIIKILIIRKHYYYYKALLLLWNLDN